jgi:hypothetical protein
MPATTKTFVFSLVISLLLVANASCKKESTGSSAPQKLTTYNEDITAVGIGHVSETFTINYDAGDRITSVVSSTKPGHRFEYNYTNEDAFTFDKFEEGKLTLHSINYINSLSLVDSVYQYNNRKDTLSYKYIYNSDKQLVTQKEYLHSYLIKNPVWDNTVTYQYDLHGTLTKKTDSYSEISYRYDAEYKNTAQVEPFYFPVHTKLPTHTYTTRWGVLVTTEHTYTFDGDKRLIGEKAVASDGRVTVKSYTYQ